MCEKPFSWIEHAAEASIFKGVDAAVLRRFLGIATHSRVRDEQIIFVRGDTSTNVYLILEGAVRIGTIAPSGKRIVVEIFQRGSLFGETAAVDGGARSADSAAMGPVEFLTFTGSAFRNLLRTSAPFANNVLVLTMDRLRRTYSLLEDASLRSLEQRLAKQILYLVKLGTTGDEAVRLKIRMHQDELADLLGVTTRSIINVLNKWRADELVGFDGRAAQLTIFDMDRFRALLDE